MTKKKYLALLIATVLAGAAASSCMGPKGDTVQEQRASAEAMREEALATLYAKKPKAREAVEASVGYAVFSNFSVHPGLLSFASGYGIIANNTTAKDTHSKWTRLTVGPGLAVKGLYVLAVFQDPELLEEFEEGRWTAGGQIEASFVFGDFGGSLEKAWLFKKGVDVYYVTHTGVAIELELFGVGKVSNNSKLNTPAAP